VAFSRRTPSGPVVNLPSFVSVAALKSGGMNVFDAGQSMNLFAYSPSL
jgi:hypothetical protein